MFFHRSFPFSCYFFKSDLTFSINVKNDVLAFEQIWKNVIQKQSLADVLLNRCSKNFANFTGKYLRPCNIIEKRLQHRCFPVKFAKFLRTPFFTEDFRWLLLVIKSHTKLFTLGKQALLSQSTPPVLFYGFIDDKNKETLIAKFFRLS